MLRCYWERGTSWSNYVLLVEIIYGVNTHPIGSAHSLEVNAVALGR